MGRFMALWCTLGSTCRCAAFAYSICVEHLGGLCVWHACCGRLEHLREHLQVAYAGCHWAVLWPFGAPQEALTVVQEEAVAWLNTVRCHR